MNEKIYDLIVPIWEDHKYNDEFEPCLDIIPSGVLTFEQELCLQELMRQTAKDSDSNTVAHNSDLIRKHKDVNGDIFYIGSNCFQKALKKNTLVNTLTNLNEIVQIPQDSNQIWFISATVRDREV